MEFNEFTTRGQEALVSGTPALDMDLPGTPSLDLEMYAELSTTSSKAHKGPTLDWKVQLTNDTARQHYVVCQFRQYLYASDDFISGFRLSYNIAIIISM